MGVEDVGSTNGTWVGAERTNRVDIRTNCVVRSATPMTARCSASSRSRSEPEPEPWPPRQPDQTDRRTGPSVDRRPTARLPLPARVMSIGRTPDNDLVVSDLGVSRKHAELRKSPTGRYQIIDLGSHNGTYVNGSRVEQAEVSEEDIIGIGHATFRLADGELREYVDEGNVSFEARDLLVQVSDGGKAKVLLEGITFPLAERSLMAVIGPAGAGKSTLLNALTGSAPPPRARCSTTTATCTELRRAAAADRAGAAGDVTHDQLTAKTALGYPAELRFPPDTGEREAHRGSARCSTSWR